MPKENEHYTCIACITIDFVMRMEKKNYPQVYLEECKYRMKKTKMTKFIEVNKNQSQSLSQNLTLNNCNVFTHSNFVLNHRWLLTGFEQVGSYIAFFEHVKKLVAIFLTLNKSESWQLFC